MLEQTGAPRENLRCQSESPSLSHEELIQPRFKPGADLTTAPLLSAHCAYRTAHYAYRTAHYAYRTAHYAYRTAHYAYRTAHYAYRTAHYLLI
jgi:hypothetical protein